jgi:DNA-binding NtrC family response regulator
MLEQFVKLNLVGESPVFMRTLALIKKVATCNAPVLIEGETGTGKENAARAIHYMSDRRDNGFVPVNCGALPDELLENELFGHEKGAFTDAKNSQAGLVNIASGGTLFLDEVDSLSPKAQAALLRFLQTQEYRPLGSRVTRYADVRILAASNSKLSDKVADKKFREDLLFRLNVLNVHMPALRERSNDIALITDALLKRFARSQGTPQKFLSPFSVYWLQRHSWPGNVRELENLLFRQFVLCEGNCIHIQDSPDFAANQHDDATEPAKQENILNFQAAKAAAIQQFEKSYLTNILARTDGNISEAARISGKERRALGKMLKKYDIDKETFYH